MSKVEQKKIIPGIFLKAPDGSLRIVVQFIPGKVLSFAEGPLANLHGIFRQNPEYKDELQQHSILLLKAAYEFAGRSTK